MPAIPFGKSTYKRENGDMPQLRLVNMIAEQSPTAPDSIILLSRLPLVEDASVGNGPIAGIFRQAGVFNGDTFVVSGTRLYRGSTVIGTIPGSGAVRFAASNKELAVVRTDGTDTAYSYNGTDFAAITLPDGDRPVIGLRSVAYVAGLFVFVAVTDGTVPGHYWFWSAPLDARTIDDLDFAAAESEPDELIDVIALNDNILLMGQTSGELWRLTGALNLPFSRISQRGTGRGAIAACCTETMDNTFLWIGNDRKVYRMEDIAKRISNHGIEESIRKSATWRAFQYDFEGHQFFCIRLDTETLAFDLSSGEWPELSTHGRANFAGQCAVTIDGTPYFGDDDTGTIWTFGDFGEADAGATAFERIFMAGFPISSGSQPIANVLVDANAGATPLDTGPGADPRLEMAHSRDGGKTYSTWRSTRLGAKGEYKRQARFGSCGMFGQPGFLARFRCMENVPLRISAVRVNESLAGRGW
jgi:hypothetical protein